jgi:hypothetical protein
MGLPRVGELAGIAAVCVISHPVVDALDGLGIPHRVMTHKVSESTLEVRFLSTRRSDRFFSEVVFEVTLGSHCVESGLLVAVLRMRARRKQSALAGA